MAELAERVARLEERSDGVTVAIADLKLAIDDSARPSPGPLRLFHFSSYSVKRRQVRRWYRRRPWRTEAEMDEPRLQVNEELMDAMAARIDELERRLEAVLGLLRRESVCKALCLDGVEFDRANRSDMTLKLRPLTHANERHRMVEARRQKAVLSRLSRVSPQRLEELLRLAKA